MHVASKLLLVVDIIVSIRITVKLTINNLLVRVLITFKKTICIYRSTLFNRFGFQTNCEIYQLPNRQIKYIFKLHFYNETYF